MVDSDGGYGCFASVRSFAEAPRASESPSGAQDISEASVIPEMREREVGSGKRKRGVGGGTEEGEEEESKDERKRRRESRACRGIALDGRTDAE